MSKRYKSESFVFQTKFNITLFFVIGLLSMSIVNSNTTNMNINGDTQRHIPSDEMYDEDEVDQHPEEKSKSNNFKNNHFYHESFVHFNKFYENEDNAYGNYEDYKKYYLNPSGPQSEKRKFKLSNRIVETKYGKLQGIELPMDEHRLLRPLEVFLGVPYATPPVGSNRFSPTRAPSPWDGVRVSNQPAPVCPQKLPDLNDEKTVLQSIPKGRLQYLKRLIPFLRNQSEDCLYLNVFAPLQTEEHKRSVPVLVYIAGEEYSLGSSVPYDGAVLSSYTELVIVTLNFRLGLLGFLNANPAPHLKARVANYGLMDQLAALHWVQQNIPAFGGDPNNVTLLGHGAGAAFVNFLIMSPAVTPGLFQRAILLSGSALSSWALVDDPVRYTLQLAKNMNCSIPEDLAKDHEIIVDCFRDATVKQLLSIDISPPNFLTAFGPSVDGVVIKTDFSKDFLTTYSAEDFPSFGPLNNMKRTSFNSHKKRSESDRRLFRNKYDLLLGAVSCEALSKFSASDIQNGIDPDKRDRLLRTYVRNAYTYHLNEIFYTIVNEYTDWETTNPMNTRDAMVAALSDAQYVAPLVQSADLLSATRSSTAIGDGRQTNTYFFVFDYQTREGFYSQKLGAVHGEELPYILGAPLVGGFGHFPENYTNQEIALSESMMLAIANFARTGNPNNDTQAEILPASKDKYKFHGINWEKYDATRQSYMEIGMKPRIKNHYRAHQLSVWLRLLPELHRAGMEDVRPQHNLFHETDLYEGIVRPDPFPRGNSDNIGNNHSIFINTAATTTDTASPTCIPVDKHSQNVTDNSIDTLEAAGYAAYSTALSVTVAIGCSLLILNVLIFAGVYYQRDKSRARHKRRRFNENHFETISGKHSHYHMDPTLTTVHIERHDKKRLMGSDQHIVNVSFKGPIDGTKSPSPSLSVDHTMLPGKLSGRGSSFRMPNVSYSQIGYATMPNNFARLNSSPPSQELRQQECSPRTTLRRGNASIHASLPQAAIDEMRV